MCIVALESRIKSIVLDLFLILLELIEVARIYSSSLVVILTYFSLRLGNFL